jgi:transposase
MWSVGLDVHQHVSDLCILNGNGKMVKQMRIRGHFSKAVAELKKLRQPFAVCYEASCGYGAIYDELKGIARRVLVAHPGQLRLIFKSKRKNDRIDAKKLALLVLLDQVPQVYVPSVDIRSWRGFIEFGHRAVAKRTQVKNGLRSLLRGQGVAMPSGKRLWTRAGRSWLAALELPTEEAMLQRDILLDDLRHFDKQIRRAEKGLAARSANHPGVWLLRTIPGVGPRTAEAVVAYIDQAKRFTRNKKVGSYFGLVPCQDSSAERNRFGHITREGPSTVRKLLTEAAWQGIRRSPQISSYFERIRAGDPDRKKIALVATAHYLVRVMLAILRTGSVWRFDQKTKKAA